MGKWSGLAIVALGVAAVGTAGLAQDKAAIVKDRQEFMKGQGADAKAIGDYAKGMGDKAAAMKAIDDLLARSGKIDALFVPGTSSTDMPGVSKAKANIWTDRANFDKISVTLHDYELKTKDAIANGTPAQVGEAAAAQGKNGCGGCHQTYREPMQH